MLTIARVIARYARFLTPEVVSAVVEDNTRHANEWRSLLVERHIDPDIYLWEGSPCAFPGVRRCVGEKERRDLRKPVTVTGPHPHCLDLDDNDYPKHLWAFVFTGKKFSKLGPNEYHLAHLADHKVYGNRWREEFAFEGDRPLPFGLFASAANTIFVPATLMKPTDFSPELRALLLRRAHQLYRGVCRFAPPPVAERSPAEGDWHLGDFRWAPPVGTTEHVPAFLEFRRKCVEEMANDQNLQQ